MLYADETIENSGDMLVFLKDILDEGGKPFLVIGSKEEFAAIEQFVPEDLISVKVERPLDMGLFLEKVAELSDDQYTEERKKSILIVDDDPSYLRMIREWLKDRFRIGMANSGMQAIQWLAGNHADLVLLDYEMPITPGPQVLEMMKAEASSSTIPVMFLTGKSDKESIMKVLSLKPAGYLLKTIKRDELIETLDNFFVEQKYKG